MARLRPLSEHDDIRFAEGSYDVRTWKVRTRVDDQEIGEVHDVLLDENARTRYLDINVKGGRHVLVPSGDVRVDASDRVVHIHGMNREGIDRLPEYEQRPESITPEYSRSLTTAYDEAYSDEHYYDRSDYSTRWSREGRREGGPEERGRRSTGKLERLDKLDDVGVASDQPDPRGWEVVGANGERIGRVDHLIGDTGAMKARYLTVDVDDEIARDRRVLVPVGHVDLDSKRNRVVSHALDRNRVGELPTYQEGIIDRDYERRLRRHFDEAYSGERAYEHPRYRSEALNAEEARVQRSGEERAVGTREHQAGDADVRKRVETERVREPLQTRHGDTERRR